MKFKNLIIFLFFIYPVSSQNGLPILDLNKEIVDFGKVLLLDSKLERLTLTNLGDTVLNFYHIDSLKPPFYGSIKYPDTLEKSEKRFLDIVYKPRYFGRDSQRVFIRADTRLSHSIALLFDVSYSMENYMPAERIRRLTAAVNAGKTFIQSMINTPKVKDEAAVFTFSGSFTLKQDFTTDKTRLINALPNILESATAFYDAVALVIDRLKLRPYKKVLIALTDGEDNRSRNHNQNSIIKLAVDNDIIIYTIGIGSTTMNTVLDNIAKQTGGLFFEARTSRDLEDIYYRIFSMLSKNIELHFDLVGYSPESQMILNCPTLPELISPADTVVYSVGLNSVSSAQALYKKYKITLKFNKSLLLPLDNDYEYNVDGTVSYSGAVTTNLDSNVLRTFRFLSLVGDAPCTDIDIVSLTWDDKFYPPVLSSDFCKICIASCVRDLRQVTSLKKNVMQQNAPNPFSYKSSLNLTIANPDYYKIELFSPDGILRQVVLDSYLETGSYEITLSSAGLASGIYFYRLISTNDIITKTLVIY